MLLSQKDGELLWGHCQQVRKILNRPGVGHRPVISATPEAEAGGLQVQGRQELASYTVSSVLAQLSEHCLKNKSV